MKKPIISIVVPIYKVPEDYLKKCVYSLINQNVKNVEIILVDDGSPDNCGIVCDELSKVDSRIKVIHKENGGLCSARNAGVKIAKGKWLAFVDGDDFIDPETYEYLLENSDDTYDVLFFGYIKDYPTYSIKKDGSRYFEDNKTYKTKEEISYIQKMILNYDGNMAMVVTKLTRLDFIKENNIYHIDELKQGAEGIEYNIRLFANAHKCKYFNKCFYHYIYNNESITTVHNENNHKMVINCFKQIKKEINNKDLDLMSWFYSRLCHVILTTAISGYFSPSNKEKYSIKKKKYKQYLKNDLILETLNFKGNIHLSTTKKITLFLIRIKAFFAVSVISKIRVTQKSCKKKVK